jgi:hypothetical protein
MDIICLNNCSASVTWVSRSPVGTVRVFCNGSQLEETSPGVYIAPTGTHLHIVSKSPRQCNKRLRGPQPKSRWS